MPRYHYPLKTEEIDAIKCAGVVNGKIKSPKGFEVPCSEKALCFSVAGQFFVVEPGGHAVVDYSVPESVVTNACGFSAQLGRAGLGEHPAVGRQHHEEAAAAQRAQVAEDVVDRADRSRVVEGIRNDVAHSHSSAPFFHA